MKGYVQSRNTAYAAYLCEREARIWRRSQKRKREAQVRAHRALVLAFAVLLLALLLSGFSRATAAKAPTYKYYTAVTVQNDDTLWGLAQEYLTEEYSSVSAYIKEVKEINGLAGSDIYYGQKLILPYYSAEQK